MPPSSDPDVWLATLARDMGDSPANRDIHAAGSALLAALRALPPGGYRDKAECMLGDCLALAFVAAR